MKKVKLSDGREITVKEPTVRMMKVATKYENDVEITAALVSQTTGLKEDEIDDMLLVDFIALQEAMEGFLSKAGVRPTLPRPRKQ